MKLAAYAMLALLTAAPAFAGPGDLRPTYDAEGTWSTRDTMQDPGRDVSSAGCVRLLERAFYLNDPPNPGRAAEARREMELARDAYREGDAFACQRHAIHALEDRT